MNFSFKNTFFALACAAAILALIYVGRPILISLSIALLTSFILYPVVQKLESWKFSRVMAAFTTILFVVICTFGVFYLFSQQIANVMDGLTNFEKKLNVLLDEVVAFVNNQTGAASTISSDDLIDKSQEWVEKSSQSIVSSTLNQSSALLSGLLVVLVYTFLLLIYRSGLKKAIVQSALDEDQSKVSDMLKEMQSVGMNYLFGMAIMIGILGVANSLVLLSFGIDHAFFFGFLAALLAIIPYVGTTIGASIPVLYAFMTHESYLIPLGVMLCFWVIQLVESNFLSPKIVGGNLNLNALSAIISLIVGGYLWGLAGMVLFLPLTAIFKVFCSYYTELKPIGKLLGDEVFISKSENS